MRGWTVPRTLIRLRWLKMNGDASDPRAVRAEFADAAQFVLQQRFATSIRLLDRLAAPRRDLPPLDRGGGIEAGKQAVSFLGLELVYADSVGEYVKKVGRKQIAKIEQKLEEEFSFENLRKERIGFQQATTDLWRTISSYLSIYRGAHDWPTLDSELRRVGRKVLANMFEDLFGAGALQRVTAEGREFLGLGSLDIPEDDSVEV
jgi:hypothetical protein